MRCHICCAKLQGSDNPFKRDNFSMCCRNPGCPMKMIVDRCNLSFSKKLGRIDNYNIWFFEENTWYKLSMRPYYDYIANITGHKLVATRFRIEQDGIGSTGKPKFKQRGAPQEILKYDQGFDIFLHDNLPEKVPKMIKRVKTLVVFS